MNILDRLVSGGSVAGDTLILISDGTDITLTSSRAGKWNFAGATSYEFDEEIVLLGSSLTYKQYPGAGDVASTVGLVTGSLTGVGEIPVVLRAQSPGSTIEIAMMDSANVARFGMTATGFFGFGGIGTVSSTVMGIVGVTDQSAGFICVPQIDGDDAASLTGVPIGLYASTFESRPGTGTWTSHFAIVCGTAIKTTQNITDRGTIRCSWGSPATAQQGSGFVTTNQYHQWFQGGTFHATARAGAPTVRVTNVYGSYYESLSVGAAKPYANNVYAIYIADQGASDGGVGTGGAAGQGAVNAIFLAGANRQAWRDQDLYIRSDNDGDLDFHADTSLEFTIGANEEWSMTALASTLRDGHNFVLGSTTGTKLGTATTEKLGLWNVTPVIQPAGALQAAITNSTGGTQDGTLVDVATIGVAIAAEVLGRLVKTSKPFGVIAGLGRLLGSMGAMLMALDKLIAKVIPQRTSSPPS